MSFLLEYVGYLGLIFLLLSFYLLTNTKKHQEKFYILNLIASVLLFIHAIIIKDVVFVFVNVCCIVMTLSYFVRKK